MSCSTPARWRFKGTLIVVAVLAALFLLPESEVLATPTDPGPDETTVKEETSRPLLARRRRWGKKKKRRARRRRPRRRRRAPKPDPTPSSDLENAPARTAAQPASAVDPGNLRRGGRVEFDGRLVQGQTAKSGAIYLFARKRSQLRSMVQERVDYRKEVLRTVYLDWQGKAAK